MAALTQWCPIALLTLALTGCGGGSSDAAAPTPPTPSGPILPPDPGAQGEITVAGIDSDLDGVRDDLQRYIAMTHPESEAVRAGLTQIAVALQTQLLSASSKSEALAAATETMRASECFFALSQGGSDAEKMIATRRLQAHALNTQLRVDAYRAFDEQVWGEVIPSVAPDEAMASCAFDPASLAD